MPFSLPRVQTDTNRLPLFPFKTHFALFFLILKKTEVQLIRNFPCFLVLFFFLLLFLLQSLEEISWSLSWLLTLCPFQPSPFRDTRCRARSWSRRVPFRPGVSCRRHGRYSWEVWGRSRAGIVPVSFFYSIHNFCLIKLNILMKINHAADHKGTETDISSVFDVPLLSAAAVWFSISLHFFFVKFLWPLFMVHATGN